MPTISSFADIVRDWEQLLTAAQENTDLAEAERYRTALADHLAAIKALKAQQDTARALKQETTRELKKKLDEGRELAIRLRGAVRANVGPRSELLVKYGVAPLRKRRRTTKPTGEKPPEESGPVLPPKAGSGSNFVH